MKRDWIRAKVCPECGHTFRGSEWDGIDTHWRAKHESVMPYALAGPLIQSNRYKRPAKREPKEDFNQAAFRAGQETIRLSESK